MHPEVKQLKIQILLFYYDRPDMVQKYALPSIMSSSYENWELAFIDDSSDQHGEELLKDFFAEHEDYAKYASQVKVYPTGDTPEDKAKRRNSIFGKAANVAVEETDADIGIMLCDDDALCLDYLFSLQNYYTTMSVAYSYCHLIPYNPSEDVYLYDLKAQPFHLNRNVYSIQPCNSLDAGQVSWRIPAFKEKKLKFDYPRTRNLDEDIFSQMQIAFGPCIFNAMVGQYKGWFDDQLGNRDSDKNFEVKIK